MGKLGGESICKKEEENNYYYYYSIIIFYTHHLLVPPVVVVITGGCLVLFFVYFEVLSILNNTGCIFSLVVYFCNVLLNQVLLFSLRMMIGKTYVPDQSKVIISTKQETIVAI